MFSISKKVFGLAGVATVFAGMAFGQATCGSPTAAPAIIRAEGTAEQLPTLAFTCTAPLLLEPHRCSSSLARRFPLPARLRPRRQLKLGSR